MGATLTPIAFELRAGPDHTDASRQDGYTASAVVKPTRNRTAEISNLSGQLYPAFRSDVHKALAAKKFKWGIWIRPDGRRKRFKVKG